MLWVLHKCLLSEQSTLPTSLLVHAEISHSTKAVCLTEGRDGSGIQTSLSLF